MKRVNVCAAIKFPSSRRNFFVSGATPGVTTENIKSPKITQLTTILLDRICGAWFACNRCKKKQIRYHRNIR